MMEQQPTPSRSHQTITVHTMGVPSWWVIPEQLAAQVRLAHSVREDLVTLQREHEDALRAIWSGYPTVAAAAETALAAAETEAAEAAAAVAVERSRLRTKRVTGPVADRLRSARAAVKTARARRREAIAAVKDDANQQLLDAHDKLRAAQKDLYRRYCTNGDLYWASFNAVADHHLAAVKRVKQRRAQGQPAALKHHRFDGSGTIAVQLQIDAVAEDVANCFRLGFFAVLQLIPHAHTASDTPGW